MLVGSQIQREKNQLNPDKQNGCLVEVLTYDCTRFSKNLLNPDKQNGGPSSSMVPSALYAAAIVHEQTANN